MIGLRMVSGGVSGVYMVGLRRVEDGGLGGFKRFSWGLY